MIQTHLGEGEVAFGLEQIGSELFSMATDFSHRFTMGKSLRPQGL